MVRNVHHEAANTGLPQETGVHFVSHKEYWLQILQFNVRNLYVYRIIVGWVFAELSFCLEQECGVITRCGRTAPTFPQDSSVVPKGNGALLLWLQ